jgi:hypothetical protein
MAQDLRIDRSEAGSFLKVEVSGTLNEALVPEQLAAIGDGRPIRIDLEKVSRITSFGVRQWVRGLEGLRERSGGLVLERCSYACVSQLNLISTFSANALIVSVMAPLRCEACEHERLIVVDVTKGPPGSLEQPCVKCGAKADLEEDPETSFAFAQSRELTNGLAALYEQLQADIVGGGRAPERAKVDPGTQAKAEVDPETIDPETIDPETIVEVEPEAKVEATALAMTPPPPPEREGDFETFEATVVHFIEDVADYLPVSELKPVRAVAEAATSEPAFNVTVQTKPPAAPLIDWSEIDQRITRWIRRRSAIALLAFGLGLLIGFLLGRL